VGRLWTAVECNRATKFGMVTLVRFIALQCSNVILPSNENYSFNPHISLEPKGPREIWGFQE